MQEQDFDPRAYRAALLERLTSESPDRIRNEGLVSSGLSATPRGVAQDRHRDHTSIHHLSSQSRYYLGGSLAGAGGFYYDDDTLRRFASGREENTASGGNFGNVVAGNSQQEQQQQQQQRSIIIDFIDQCVAHHVPDAVIAEHVQFMIASMREVIGMHDALHARFHQDRIREFEISELANLVERQHLEQKTFSGSQPERATTLRIAAGSAPMGTAGSSIGGKRDRYVYPRATTTTPTLGTKKYVPIHVTSREVSPVLSPFAKRRSSLGSCLSHSAGLRRGSSGRESSPLRDSAGNTRGYYRDQYYVDSKMRREPWGQRSVGNFTDLESSSQWRHAAPAAAAAAVSTTPLKGSYTFPLRTSPEGRSKPLHRLFSSCDTPPATATPAVAGGTAHRACACCSPAKYEEHAVTPQHQHQPIKRWKASAEAGQESAATARSSSAVAASRYMQPTHASAIRSQSEAAAVSVNTTVVDANLHKAAVATEKTTGAARAKGRLRQQLPVSRPTRAMLLREAARAGLGEDTSTNATPAAAGSPQSRKVSSARASTTSYRPEVSSQGVSQQLPPQVQQPSSESLATLSPSTDKVSRAHFSLVPHINSDAAQMSQPQEPQQQPLYPWRHLQPPPINVTSPELQMFMEMCQRKVRETDRVLARAPSVGVTTFTPPQPSAPPRLEQEAMGSPLLYVSPMSEDDYGPAASDEERGIESHDRIEDNS